MDAVLGALPDDGDAPAAGSWVHDLAMEQVSETGSGARIGGHSCILQYRRKQGTLDPGAQSRCRGTRRQS